MNFIVYDKHENMRRRGGGTLLTLSDSVDGGKKKLGTLRVNSLKFSHYR